MSPTIVRFAPSPTGRIHIGNARTALLNYLFARKHGGEFILRFDDTDIARSTEEFAQSIEVDLAWLKVVPHYVARQSQRGAAYAAAAQRLKTLGRLYPCYETADELDRKRKRQQARGLPPIYDRAALNLTADDRARFEAEGRHPHWRFRLEPKIVHWNDLVRGDSHIDSASLSDPILIREDGTYLYTLPSVVDDIDMKISHVIRGEDHVTNTAVQMQLFEALAGESAPPRFAHHNLLTTVTGEGLSKRSGALSIGNLREEGIESLAVAAFAVLTGSSEAVHPISCLHDLVTKLDFAHISRTQARFDPAELANLSARTLHGLPYEAVRNRLAAHDIAGRKAEGFWLAVRGNLTSFLQVCDWWRVVEGEIIPIAEDRDFLAQAIAVLPEEPWDGAVWGRWVQELKTVSGRKGRGLFHPLRMALTARDDGPELANLLPLMGRLKVSARLSGHAA